MKNNPHLGNEVEVEVGKEEDVLEVKIENAIVIKSLKRKEIVDPDILGEVVVEEDEVPAEVAIKIDMLEDLKEVEVAKEHDMLVEVGAEEETTN